MEVKNNEDIWIVINIPKIQVIFYTANMPKFGPLTPPVKGHAARESGYPRPYTVSAKYIRGDLKTLPLPAFNMLR